MHVCLTLLALSNTYSIGVAISVSSGLQVQGVDLVCVQLISEHHALLSCNVSADLGEILPVMCQLLNFVHLKERGGETDWLLSDLRHKPTKGQPGDD